MTPLFSVVIPLYNKADTIERAVRSVWRQTFHDYELIVVNDGSTDDSLAVVRRLAEEREIIVISQTNAGVSAARNAGEKAAHGNYIALLDADDVWYERHLERMSKAINKFPDVKLLGGGYEWDGGDRFFYRTISYPACRIVDVYTAYRYAQPMHTSSIVIEKKAWEKCGGFDVRYGFYEDIEFFFRLGGLTKCCVVPGVSERHMMDAGESITGKKSNRTFNQAWPHLCLIENLIREGKATSAMIAFAMTRLKVMNAFSLISGSDAEIIQAKNAFPGIWSFYVPIKCSFFARLFLLYFRFRVHIILWKRLLP